ncbi:MAG: tetratricopeptide repeat-containing sensor histidine kinase [bacterium]|nr:tetratricopeptide repeat-containing sensor histidine kinase [bacterium]
MSKHNSYLSYSFALLIILLINATYLLGQVSKVKALKYKLSHTNLNDSVKIRTLGDLAYAFSFVHPDSTIKYAKQCLTLSENITCNWGITYSLSILAMGMHANSDNVSAIKYINQSLDLARQTGDNYGEATALNNKAIIYHNLGKLDIALVLYKESLNIRKESKNLNGIANSYNNIGNTYVDKANYPEALESHFNSLQIREELNDSMGMANSYGNIAGIYYLLKKLDETNAYAKKALDMQIILGDYDGIIQSSIALGGVCFEKKEYRKAIDYFNFAKEKAKDQNNLVFGYSKALINLGEVYNEINLPDSAMLCYDEALSILEPNEEIRGISFCEIGLGRSLLLKNKVKEAIVRLKKGYDLAFSLHNKLHLLEGAKYLADAYEKEGNYTLSNQYLRTYIIYNDSIFNEESVQRSHKIEFNYILEKKQNEISLLEKDKVIQKAKNDFQSLLLIGLIVTIILLIVFIYYVNRFRVKEVKAKELIVQQKTEIEKQAQNLASLNNFKNKTFSILSHDLRSPISSLTQVLDLIDQDVMSEEDFKALKQNFRAQLKSINILLDNTLNWAKSQMNGEHNPVKSHVNIDLLVERNFQLFHQIISSKSIEVKKEIDSDLTAWVDTNHLDIVLRNIIFNAIKFTNNYGHVTVKASKENGRAIIQIIDTGKGMSKEVLDKLFTYNIQSGTFGTNGERGAGIGLILTNDFIERNEGTISVQSQVNQGSEFNLSFPLN